MGEAPENGRITDVNVVLNSTNPKASIGLLLNNRARKALCLLELTAAKQTILFCLNGDKRRDIANVPNVASVAGQMQNAFDGWLHKKTGAEKEHNVPLVFVGASMNDRSSYNAALRAGTLGWPAFGTGAGSRPGSPTACDGDGQYRPGQVGVAAPRAQ